MSQMSLFGGWQGLLQKTGDLTPTPAPVSAMTLEAKKWLALDGKWKYWLLWSECLYPPKIHTWNS